jgi:hypothetical protein
MDIADAYRIIERRYRELDAKTKEAHGKLFFDTKFGIWGASSMLDAYELFLRMHLDQRKSFVDLGSGDGRIALIAALFTESCGIEGDAALSAIAVQIKNELLPQIPELSRCNFISADFTAADLSGFEVLFTFADHTWSAAFEEKLQHECKGILLSYNRIFLPQKLRKGRTYWVQQLPIVTYALNTEERPLF